MTRAALALALVACSSGAGPEELKLGHRSKDAGPPVVIVDKIVERATGPTVPEHEPNDAKSGGQNVTLPLRLEGKIDGADDWDVFNLAVPSAGTLRVTLSAVDDADLVLEAQSATGELLAVSDNGPAKVAEAIPNLFVQPGTVRLVVHEYRKPAPKPKKGHAAPASAPARTTPSGTYLLEATLGPPPVGAQAVGDAGRGEATVVEEREPNNEAAFATELGLGATGRGYIGWKKDVDVWKVALEGVRDDDALAVDVDAVTGVALKVTVSDGTGATVLERRGATSAPLALRSVQIRPDNPVYFVAVSGDRPNADEQYALRVTTAPIVLDEESEPNDNPAQASPLADVPGAESGTRVGTLPAGDVDFYKLDAAAAPRTLAVTVTPPATVEVELSVLGSDGKTPVAGPAAGGKRGADAKLAAVAVAADAVVYVRVAARAGASGTERYRLRWALAAAAAPVPGVDDQ
jgi:hypothetical protein